VRLLVVLGGVAHGMGAGKSCFGSVFWMEIDWCRWGCPVWEMAREGAAECEFRGGDVLVDVEE
jgi:hypothetical protein